MIKKVLKMSASWCMPCKVYSKTFNEVKNEEKYKDITFEELDVEDNEDLAIKYGVRGVPTTIIFDENDKVISMFSGNMPKSELEKRIDTVSNG